MDRYTSRGRLVALALGVALSVAAPGRRAAAQGATGNPGIVPSTDRPYGATYGEWGARWWQWVFSLPTSSNPMLGETGAAAANGQPFPHVFFLASVITASGSAERRITVPSGTAFFTSLLSVEWDNVGVGPPGYTIQQLYALAAAQVANPKELHASIDGQPLSNLTAYRGISPPFSYTLPATDNLLQFLGFDVWGLIRPAVSDGYWLMISPLTVGEHTINLGGTTPDGRFTLDITYHVTVVPRGQA